jgi:SMP-30/Gluconolactonase/LRE-like region
VIAVDLDGNSEVMLRGESFPLCVDWLPDGRLLVVSAGDGLLLRREQDGSLVTHGDLKAASDPPAVNELVVDARGNAYVNGGGFDLMPGEPFTPGVIALVGRDGSVRQVADGLAFPNGMLVMPDGSTLIVAESYAKRLTAFDIDADGSLSNRRVWGDLGEGVPDSICVDEENAVWYADVPNKRCVRVGEGGKVLDTIELDRACFACGARRPQRHNPVHARERVGWSREHGVPTTSLRGTTLSVSTIRIPFGRVERFGAPTLVGCRLWLGGRRWGLVGCCRVDCRALGDNSGNFLPWMNLWPRWSRSATGCAASSARIANCSRPTAMRRRSPRMRKRSGVRLMQATSDGQRGFSPGFARSWAT